MSFTVSIKRSEHGFLIVITDSEIVGKKFEEGKLQLDLSKDFYKGEEKNEEQTKVIIKEARHLHLTGEKTVALGISLNLVDKDKIITVQKIPHAEVVIE